MVAIRPLAGENEARRCAEMMCSTEPWLTLRRNFDESLAIVNDPTSEVYVAVEGDRVLGFIILMMRAVFSGSHDGEWTPCALGAASASEARSRPLRMP